MTLIVLALDALDAGLIDHFGVEQFTLDEHGPLETLAYGGEQPYTPEAWATAATGLHPREHGVTGSGTSEWSNPLLQLASKVTAHLPEGRRGDLGALVRRLTGAEASVGQTTSPTIFDREDAVVRNWPGVTDGRDLQFAWGLMRQAVRGGSRRTFERDLFGLCAEQFAWAREMLNHDVAVAGVHVHTLDAAGHAYRNDEAALGHVYERVGSFTSDLVSALGPDDDLILLSDHGMTVSFYGDDADGKEPGYHSWRAYVSATTGPLPSHIRDLPDWVDANVTPTDESTDDSTFEIPEDQLRELGYLE